jgi:2,3-bisphosphoglycerate-dependent phosphoglycerate mutase
MDLYLVRHCQAEGQAPEAPLTAAGRAQAEQLADFLVGADIRRIVSSPFARARQSIEPLARRLGIPIETDDRLAERVLCPEPLPDWRDRLRASFDDPDFCLPGGESGRTATERGVAAIQDALRRHDGSLALVTHGNLLALLLRHFDGRVGFEEWQALTNPDVFRVSIGDSAGRIHRVWTDQAAAP